MGLSVFPELKQLSTTWNYTVNSHIGVCSGSVFRGAGSKLELSKPG